VVLVISTLKQLKGNVKELKQKFIGHSNVEISADGFIESATGYLDDFRIVTKKKNCSANFLTILTTNLQKYLTNRLKYLLLHANQKINQSTNTQQSNASSNINNQPQTSSYVPPNISLDDMVMQADASDAYSFN